MKKITPFLWFDNNCEEAMNFYMSVFKNSKVLSHNSVEADGEQKKGTVNSCRFELEGQEFTAFNGGPYFKFTEAISLFVNCRDQSEVDELWEKLSEGGSKSQCGWLKDKFGLSWQIIPSQMTDLMYSDDEKKSEAVMNAMMKMTKIEIDKLQQAYDQA